MSEQISTLDQLILRTISRLGAIRAAHVSKHPGLQSIPTAEAATKRLDRLCDKGLLAASTLPRGPKLYRPSNKGIRLTNAPKSFAKQPTSAKLAELISISSSGWNVDEIVFLTMPELQSMAQELSTDSLPDQFPGRFVLRTIRTPNSCTEETQLSYWFAELRTPDQILKRVETIIQKLAQQRLFSQLLELDLFKVAIAVPTASAKAAVEAKKFPVRVEVLVIEELQDIVP